jgi:hypothetical protein
MLASTSSAAPSPLGKKINLLGYQDCWILGRNSATGTGGRQTGPECRHTGTEGLI